MPERHAPDGDRSQFAGTRRRPPRIGLPTSAEKPRPRAFTPKTAVAVLNPEGFILLEKKVRLNPLGSALLFKKDIIHKLPPSSSKTIRAKLDPLFNFTFPLTDIAEIGVLLVSPISLLFLKYFCISWDCVFSHILNTSRFTCKNK